MPDAAGYRGPKADPSMAGLWKISNKTGKIRTNSERKGFDKQAGIIL